MRSKNEPEFWQLKRKNGCFQCKGPKNAPVAEKSSRVSPDIKFIKIIGLVIVWLATWAFFEDDFIA
jgi:hypothetical protein